MSRNFSQAVVLALGIVVAALLLRSSPEVGAQSPAGSHAVYFSASLFEGQSKVLGTVPAGKTLLLKDFWTPIHKNDQTHDAGFFKILADGLPVTPRFQVGFGAGNDDAFSLAVGFKMPSGKEIAIERTAGGGSPAAAELVIAGVLQ